jgi:Zn-dependent peptidase ImmA (M78 family)
MISKEQKQALRKLRALAWALGFRIRIYATKEMKEYYLAGLADPEKNMIYVNPAQDQIPESAAHEIGHVIVIYLGINEDLEDTPEEERIVDRIAIAILKSIDYDPKVDAEDKLSSVNVGE